MYTNELWRQFSSNQRQCGVKSHFSWTACPGMSVLDYSLLSFTKIVLIIESKAQNNYYLSPETISIHNYYTILINYIIQYISVNIFPVKQIQNMFSSSKKSFKIFSTRQKRHSIHICTPRAVLRWS